MIKIILMVLAFVPLFIQLPYLWQAWMGSRLDKFDWIFYLLAIAASIWAGKSEKVKKYDYYALFLLIPLLFLAFSSPLHHINALSVAAAAGVIYTTVWLLASWDYAYKVLPAFVILLLGTPSSSYQMSLLLMCPVLVAWSVKFLLAVLCLTWIWCNQYFNWQVKKGTIFFSAAVLASSLLLLHTKEIYFEGKSFIPVFGGHVGEFWRRNIQPDANTRRFFATSTVKQYRYTGNNIDISVLAVQCGRDIHEIHPASHCLRTSMWTVHSEKLLYLQDNFAVTEIDAQKGNNRILVWVWYSSEKFSTPGFLGFRRHFSRGSNYYTYQISVPVYESITQSRSELRKFIKSVEKAKP